jgi:3-methyladenine DNA glycosylase AlkD
MIVTGAWWDFVDEIAANLVGELLRNHAKPMRATLRRWSKDADLWRRRSAILAQLKFRQATDAKLLFELIAPSLKSDEFFLRKAIGWALREYAKSAPKVVRYYVAENEEHLSALSRREALRRIGA